MINIVITPLPGRYRLYTRSDIYNPEGLGISLSCVSIMHAGVITDLTLWKPYKSKKL